MSATKCPRCNTPGITFQGVGDTDDVELKCYACNHTSGLVSNYGAAVARFYSAELGRAMSDPAKSKEAKP